MSLAPYLPLSFRGTLHDIRLLNFSIDTCEAQLLLPPPLRAGNFQGRALVSMVSVRLRSMRLRSLPTWSGFGYRHVAFRLLVDDSQYTDGSTKGIYFVRSFVHNPLLALGGNILTDFRFSTAHIEQTPEHLIVASRSGSITASFSGQPAKANPDLQTAVGAVDRAYTVHKRRVYKVQIQRSSWPLVPLECTYFQTSFFHSTRFEGAFIVPETIPYMWLPPQEILS